MQDLHRRRLQLIGGSATPNSASAAQVRKRFVAIVKGLADPDQLGVMKERLRRLKRAWAVHAPEYLFFADIVPAGDFAVGLHIQAVAHHTTGVHEWIISHSVARCPGSFLQDEFLNSFSRVHFAGIQISL